MLKPLDIVAFYDGRAGHEKQTRGILQALSGLTPTQTVRTFTIRPSFKTGLSNWLVYLTSVFRPREKTAMPVDLIIGTGSYTHIPMLLLKKTCRARAVTCMTPDVLLKNRFDLCFVPHHDRRKPAANFFFTVGPPNNLLPQNRQESDKGLILIGGIDKKSHTWRSERTVAQVRRIIETERSIFWTISSSPRTPRDMLTLIEELTSQMPQVRFFRSEDTPVGWIEEQYARCDRVWVTADSVSMVFEALTAGCRVGILPVKWKHRHNKFQQSLDALHRNDQIVLFETWQSGGAFKEKKAGLEEASRCAEEILRRWWPDRLK